MSPADQEHLEAKASVPGLLVTVLLTISLLLCAVALFGCASSAQQVLTSENSYYFYLGEYERSTCKTVAAPECKPRYDALKNLKLRCTEAADAVKRGGKPPLQLRAMKTAEKAVKAVQ